MYLSKDEIVKMVEDCKNDYINNLLLDADDYLYDSEATSVRIDFAKISSVMSLYNSIIEALNMKEEEEK